VPEVVQPQPGETDPLSARLVYAQSVSAEHAEHPRTDRAGG
jgi:hypothetical protein